MKVRRVAPIDEYVPGQPIVVQPLENSIDNADAPDAADRLTEWVNDHTDLRVVKSGIEGFTPFDSVVRLTVPSVEGPVEYDYLAITDGSS